ncbi:MAG: peptide transporter [Thiotrichales bacterium]|nr:MAG: peptide transporter [Thiotrichales bacterium]
MQLDNEIHIYTGSITQIIISPDVMICMLSKNEIQKAQQFRHQQDKLRFILARYILRTKLAQYLHISPISISLEYNDYGKPMLSAELAIKTPIYFNISHSRDLVMVGFSQNTIGVDIEHIGPVDANLMNDLVLNPDELSYINSLPDNQQQSQEFYKIWTIKEAYMKAIGTGLSMPADKVNIKSDLQPIQVNHKYNKNNYIAISLTDFDLEYAHSIVILKQDVDKKVISNNGIPPL